MKHVIGGLVAGFLLGAIVLLMIFQALDVFRPRGQPLYVVVAPTPTPTPIVVQRLSIPPPPPTLTPTPAPPTPTPTPDQRGVLWTVKKKKKSTPVVAFVSIGSNGIAYWTHICCEDALTHRVQMKIIPYFGLKGIAYGIEMIWTVDEELTKENRIKKWGPGWNRPSSPLDPFSAEHRREPAYP